MNGAHLHYGCGLSAPLSWRNFDASPSLCLQQLPLLGWVFQRDPFPNFPPNVEFGNIVRGLPLRASSCSAVYCSHILEHLALEDFRIALANTYNLLTPDGTFRFVMPDFERLVSDYRKSSARDAALTFMRHSGLGQERRLLGLATLVRTWFGNSSHLWMWDFTSAAMELERVGFRNIRRAEFGDARDYLFRDVENPERWRGSLGLECVK